MIILGVDPGSVITGIGVIESKGNRLSHIHSDVIRLKSFGEIPARLVALEGVLSALFKEYQPQAVSVEKVFHGVNFKSTLLLGYIRGVILLVAARMELPLFEYAATEVKLAVTGYGRAEKSQIQEMVKRLLNLKTIPKPHDKADALALAITHAHSARPYL